MIIVDTLLCRDVVSDVQILKLNLTGVLRGVYFYRNKSFRWRASPLGVTTQINIVTFSAVRTSNLTSPWQLRCCDDLHFEIILQGRAVSCSCKHEDGRYDTVTAVDMSVSVLWVVALRTCTYQQQQQGCGNEPSGFMLY